MEAEIPLLREAAVSEVPLEVLLLLLEASQQLEEMGATVAEEGRKKLQLLKLRIQSFVCSSICAEETLLSKPTRVPNMCINQRILLLFLNGNNFKGHSLINRFKRLSVEERVNSLSTVCPHLTEIFINMYQRSDGSSSFARIGPHSS